MARKKKQTEIPGTERQHDEELSSAAHDLRDVRARRMELTEEETDAADRLIGLMRKKGLVVYVDEESEIRVALKPGKDRVSITKLSAESEVDVDEAAE